MEKLGQVSPVKMEMSEEKKNSLKTLIGGI